MVSDARAPLLELSIRRMCGERRLASPETSLDDVLRLNRHAVFVHPFPSSVCPRPASAARQLGPN